MSAHSAPSRRVLIVDDDVEMRAVLCRACARAGLEADQAESGVEALQMIRRARYGAVTMDVAMRDLDGIDTVAVIRTESDVPIIAISAHLSDEIRLELRTRGVGSFVEKPFTIAQVTQALTDALGADV